MESVAWSPNSQYLAVHMRVQDGSNTLGPIITYDEIQIWKASTHTRLTAFFDGNRESYYACFSWAPDSKRLVLATESTYASDNAIIWSVFGSSLHTYLGNRPEIVALVAWSPNGAYIAQTATQVGNGKNLQVTEIWAAPAGR